jgi:hypothetical protein
VAGPYRAEDWQDACAVCAQAADRACPRCNQPLCARHLAPVLGVCASCELELVEHGGLDNNSLARAPWAFGLVFVTATAGFALGLMTMGPIPAAFGFLAGLMAPFAAGRLWAWKRHRRLVGEVRARAALAAPRPPPPGA